MALNQETKEKFILQLQACAASKNDSKEESEDLDLQEKQTIENPDEFENETPEQKKARLKAQEAQLKVDTLSCVFGQQSEALKKILQENPKTNFNSIQFEKTSLLTLALRLGHTETLKVLANHPTIIFEINGNENYEWLKVFSQDKGRSLLKDFFDSPAAIHWFKRQPAHEKFYCTTPMELWMAHQVNNHIHNSNAVKQIWNTVSLEALLFMKKHLKPKINEKHPLSTLPDRIYVPDSWSTCFNDEAVFKETADWILMQGKNIQKNLTKALFNMALKMNHPQGMKKVFRHLNEPLVEIISHEEPLICESINRYSRGIDISTHDLNQDVVQRAWASKNNTVNPFYLLGDDQLFKNNRIPVIAYALSKGFHAVAKLLSQMDYFKEESQFNHDQRLSLSRDIFKTKGSHQNKIRWDFLYGNASQLSAKGLQTLIKDYGFDPQTCFMDDVPLVSMALYQDIAKTRLEDWYRKCPSLFDTVESIGMSPLEMASKNAPMAHCNQSKLDAKKALIEKMMIKKSMPTQRASKLNPPPKAKRL